MDTYIPPPDASKPLGGPGLPSGNAQRMIAAVKAGIPARSFNDLAGILGVSEAALAAVVGISTSTLMRRKRTGHFTPEEGEHIVRVACLLELATQTFGELESARDWLRRENLSLAGKTPLSYADTEIGAREVENLLGRILYGVYS